MKGCPADGVGTFHEHALDVFVVEQARAIHELIEHPGGDQLERFGDSLGSGRRRAEIRGIRITERGRRNWVGWCGLNERFDGFAPQDGDGFIEDGLARPIGWPGRRISGEWRIVPGSTGGSVWTKTGSVSRKWGDRSCGRFG